MDPSSTMPSWRSGKTHGFCVTGGHSPIASEPTPSPRLWATAPGATPVRLCEHTMRVSSWPSKPELSTWLETGTFYLAPTHQKSHKLSLMDGRPDDQGNANYQRPGHNRQGNVLLAPNLSPEIARQKADSDRASCQKHNESDPRENRRVEQVAQSQIV